MRKLFVLAMIVVAIVVLPSLAMADGDKDKGKKDPKGRRPDASKMFERLDADKDGKITISELPERMKERLGEKLKKADTNGDGKICKEEFKAMVKARMEAAKAKRDKGRKGGPKAKAGKGRKDGPQARRGKGKKDGPGAGRSLGKRGLPTPDFKEMFKRFDSDGDGKLCVEEFTTGAKKLHQRVAAHMRKTAALRHHPGMHRPGMHRPGMRGPGMRGPGKRGPALGGPEMAKKMLAGMEKRFDTADKNKDGKVTLEEVPSEMKERFGKLLEKYDSDGDKALTKEEGKKFADDMIKKFSQARKRGPGKPGMRRPNPEMIKKMRTRMEERFKAADKDGDGKISKDEANDRLKAHFEKIDANKDGKLCQEELKKAFEARRKEMEKHPRRGAKGPGGPKAKAKSDAKDKDRKKDKKDKGGKKKAAPPKPPKS